MVTFLPFEGYRPAIRAGEKISERISPPYDVIGDDHLKELQSNRNNVTNLTLKPDADKRYKTSRKELDRMIEDGSLLKDTPSFYVYEQNFDDKGISRTRTGLVGILRTEEYSQGNIIPHEETFSKVKEDRLNLLRDMETHLESIFGIYEGLSPELNKSIADNAQLVYRHKDEQNVEHRYYRLADAGICERISEELKDQKMLIADGHHRYETALNYAKENPDVECKQYVLATLVASDNDGLVIWPTHRLVDSGDISEKNAILKISKELEMVPVEESELKEKIKDHQMGLMFKTGKCFVADSVKRNEGLWTLDTYITQEAILKGVYKSDEDKAKVSYDAEWDSAVASVKDGTHDLVVLYNRPKLQTIWDLSMVGKKMPKKTTFFFPKIWSGFVFYLMH